MLGKEYRSIVSSPCIEICYLSLSENWENLQRERCQTQGSRGSLKVLKIESVFIRTLKVLKNE